MKSNKWVLEFKYIIKHYYLPFITTLEGARHLMTLLTIDSRAAGSFYEGKQIHQMFASSKPLYPSYPCQGYGFFWGTLSSTPTRTPEKPLAVPLRVAVPLPFPRCSSYWPARWCTTPTKKPYITPLS